MNATRLDWQQDPLLGSWTAHLDNQNRYLIQSDPIRNWPLYQTIQDRYYARLIRYRAPQQEVGHFDTVEEAKQACDQHRQEQHG